MKKIIIWNIIILFTLSILTEIICFTIKTMKYPHFDSIKYNFSMYLKKPSFYFYDIPCEEERPVSGINYKKKPILLFGCSVTYGNGLSDNNNFSAILSRETKRPVYNLGQGGFTISHMLRELELNKKIENINPEYIIFTYINDHKKRLYFYQGWINDTGLYLRYKYDKNGKLKPIKREYPFYYKFYTVKYIQQLIVSLKIKNKEATSNLMIDLFKESSNIIKKRYPNAKLIMLLYWDFKCNNDNERHIHNKNNILSNREIKELTNLGFEIISIEELANKPFCTPEYKVDEFHPSSKMWEEFVPILVKKYKM